MFFYIKIRYFMIKVLSFAQLIYHKKLKILYMLVHLYLINIIINMKNNKKIKINVLFLIIIYNK